MNTLTKIIINAVILSILASLYFADNKHKSADTLNIYVSKECKKGLNLF